MMDWAEREYGRVDLGDRRLSRRVLFCAAAIGASPAAGFPEAFANASDLEGFYRMVNNERVQADELLLPHHDASWDRACNSPESHTLVLHDTSEFVFKGEVARERMMAKTEGSSFFGHFALAVSEGPLPVVHGVVGQGVYRLEDGIWVEGQAEEEEVELLLGSDRWLDVATRVHHATPETQNLVHVMDREADDYALLSQLSALGDDFVVRSQHDRKVGQGDDKLSTMLESQTTFAVVREVALSRRGRRRPPGARKKHPGRDARNATLMVRGCCVELVRPEGVAPVGNARLPVSVVQVTEIDPPEGETPVHWRILTSLPVDTEQDIERVVDIYRKRWLIEEFFKALKTGCSAEKRQGRSLHSLWNMTAMLVPIACRILRLRVTARSSEEHKYSAVIDDIELLALRELVPKKMLGKSPTARDAMLAIARLGGHLTSNGEPGWQTLGRGMERLHTTAIGWRAAFKAMGKSPESLM